MLANKRYLIIVVIVFLLGLLLAPSVAYGSAQSSENSQGIRRINAGYIELTEAHRNDPSTIRAFIPTDSSSRICLATLNEASFPVAGMTVFCQHRVVDGVKGVNIEIWHPVDLPDQFIVVLTVYHDNAKRYGEPVLNTGD
jgi:hypothetical protein